MKRFFKLLSGILATGAVALSMGAVGCGTSDVIKVGVTVYEPMDYINDAGEWVGFDAELSRKVFSELGYKVEFVEIDWETKVVTLEAGTIDVIWNGMTVTDSLSKALTLSDPYLENRQYGLVKAGTEGEYTGVESVANKRVAFESGSAAAEAVVDMDCVKNGFSTQSAAVLEAAAGTSDIAVVDYTMAMTITAEGSDYYGRLVAVDLGFESEKYAVGFRKADTELCGKVNAELKKLFESGYMKTLAEKYGVVDLLTV